MKHGKNPELVLHQVTDEPLLAERCRDAARAIEGADGLLIAAGAGMGVDSGLPDFRGTQGFWAAYPALGAERIGFADIANPRAFTDDPRLAWGFYGHRLQLYRQTNPHVGFDLLRMIAQRLEHGPFVFTSNVDGAFQKAGFSEGRVVECHGSIHYLQCSDGCTDTVWTANELSPEVEIESCRLVSVLPTCSECGAVARPNVLMFGDSGWNARPTEQQKGRLNNWLGKVQRLAVIEIGAGIMIPTVRHFADSLGNVVIRINPVSDGEIDSDEIFIEATALKGIQGIVRELWRD